MFQPKVELTESEVSEGLRWVLLDGVASHLMSTLTGGVILVALAIQLNASNFVIGVIAAIPAITQLVQIPAIYIIERMQNRKIVTLVTAALGRLPLLLIALAPFIAAPQQALLIIIAALAVHTGISSIGGCSFNSWMRDLVPEDKLGQFFSRRMKLSLGIGLLLSLFAGGWIDWWQKAPKESGMVGFSALFVLGFILGMTGVYFLSRIIEPRMIPSPAPFLPTLLQPFKSGNFRRLIVFSGAWTFAVNLAAPFFTVYLLKWLGLDMSAVVMLSILSQTVNFFFVRLWGNWADRYSNKAVLAVGCPLFLAAVLAWTFTTMPGKHFFTIPLLIMIHAVMGLANAGISVASGNLGLKLAPKGQATAYLVANSMVMSVMATLAPILGGLFADFFASRELDILIRWKSPGGELSIGALSFSHWDFFFVSAFFIGLYALHRLSLVEEEGEVDDRFVRDELADVLLQPIRGLSSVAGIFQLLSVPLSFFRDLTGILPEGARGKGSGKT